MMKHPIVISAVAALLLASSVEMALSATIVDEGTISDTPPSNGLFFTYTGTTTGPFDAIYKFAVTGPIATFNIAVSESDPVLDGVGINGGVVELFKCTGNCTGAAQPTGTFKDSAPILPATVTASTDFQSGGFKYSSMGIGPYYIELKGSETGTGGFDLYASGSGVSSAVPEISTWAMLLLGFAGLGLAGYVRSANRAWPLSAT